MQHHFEQGVSRTGYQQFTLVIEVAVLDLPTLSALPEYLITNVNCIFEQAKRAEESAMFPVAIRANQLTFSEQSLWSLVCDTLPNAKELVVKYIQTLCQLARGTCTRHLVKHDEYHFVGAYAVIPFYTRYFDNKQSTTAAALPVYQSFVEFIRCCDLDEETYEDHYIEEALRKLKIVDKDLMIELFCFRICNGQCSDKDFRFLYQHIGMWFNSTPLLKPVLDFLVANADNPDFVIQGQRTYLCLCAAIYGSHLKETDEVMAYVEQKLGTKYEPLHPNLMKNILRIRREADVFQEFRPSNEGILDSSFHLYDSAQKQWLPKGT